MWTKKGSDRELLKAHSSREKLIFRINLNISRRNLSLSPVNFLPSSRQHFFSFQCLGYNIRSRKKKGKGEHLGRRGVEVTRALSVPFVRRHVDFLARRRQYPRPQRWYLATEGRNDTDPILIPGYHRTVFHSWIVPRAIGSEPIEISFIRYCLDDLEFEDVDLS